jgi:hypothetical protein
VASSLYPSYKQLILGAGLNLTSLTIRAAILDVATYGLSIATVSNTNPIVVTTGIHGLSAGMLVSIVGVVGCPNANGLRRVGTVSSTTFELLDPDTGLNVVGNGAYVSGGEIILLGLHSFRASLTGVAAISAAMTGKSITNGVFAAADVTFTSVAAGPELAAVVLYRDSGSSATDELIAYIDNVTGIPVTPNGSNITVNWDTALNKIFSL